MVLILVLRAATIVPRRTATLLLTADCSTGSAPMPLTRAVVPFVRTPAFPQPVRPSLSTLCKEP